MPQPYPHLSFNEPARTAWQNTIDAMGYPANLRKIALINGSATGGLYKTPCNDLIHYRVSKLGSPYNGFLLSELRARFQQGLSGSQCNAFDGQAVSSLWLPSSPLFSFAIPGFVSYRGSLDAAPGGTYNTVGVVKAQSPIGTFSAGQLLGQTITAEGQIFGYGGDNHTFIPSVSSLGFLNSNFNWANNINTVNLLCTSPAKIPFDNYFTARTNESHVFISTEAAAWVKQEIERSEPTQNCPTICSRNFAGSASQMCVNSTRTLTLDVPAPTGYTVTWTTSPAFQILSQSATGVTVKAIANDNAAQVTAVIGNPCGGDVTLRTIIPVGAPVGPGAPNVALSQGPNCYKWTATVTIQAPPPGESVTWSVKKITTPSCNPGCTTNGSGGGSASYILHNGEKIAWNLTYTNSCGPQYAGRTFELVSTGTCANPSAYLNDLGPGMLRMIQQDEPRLLPPSNYLTVSPNPTKDFWTVAVYDQRVETLSVEVLDLMGRCLYKQHHSEINMSDINVPAANLTPGTYLLRTVTNLRTETFKVEKIN